MDLLLSPRWTFGARTLGQLSVNGAFFCYTLEDQIREVKGQLTSAWKVDRATAIPEGRYRIELVDSPKFGKQTLTLIEVNDFKYIRIHSGNDEDDTEGCILVGDVITPSLLLRKSKVALARLKAIVIAAIARGESVWIDIRTGPWDQPPHANSQAA
jgi:hypothetical protein